MLKHIVTPALEPLPLKTTCADKSLFLCTRCLIHQGFRHRHRHLQKHFIKCVEKCGNPYKVDDKAATAKRAKAGKEHVWLFQSFEDEILAAQLHQWLRLLSLTEGKSRTLHQSGSINVVQLSSKISPALYLQNLPEIGGHLPKHV